MSGVPGYQLERLIGRGAAGEVWLGRQRAAGGRVVAIKRLPTGDGRALRDELRSEGELLASLDHPHILTLYDVVDCAGGVALVVQYAGGGSLASLLEQRRLTAGQLVSIAAPLAEALAYAHGRGVVHADVTPANVLFTEAGRPLLADFGIALAARRLVTRSGLSGTPDYLDPELADGARPDARSDIYGLGVICWEALAGRPPYAGGSPFEIVERARIGERPRLSDLAPEAPGALVAVIDAALARRREGRYADAAQLAAALTSVVAPEPVALLPRPVDGPVRPPARPTRDFGPRPPQPAAAPPQPAAGRLSPLRIRLAVLALAVVAVAGGVAATADRATAGRATAGRATAGQTNAGRAAERGSPAPLARPDAAVAPVPTEDWRAVLAALDGRRSAAFASADVRMLAEVYAPGEALRVDTARVAALAKADERVTGLQLRYVDVQMVEHSADRVRLLVTDELTAYRRVAASGQVLQEYAGRGGRQWTVELVAGSAGWRISAVS